MLRYELINRELIVSRTARHVYRVSAILSIALPFLVAAILLKDIPPALAPFARPLLFLCVFGTALTFVGMEVFLFQFDNSKVLKQVVWFGIMLIPLIGAPLYYFLVYLRSDILREACERTRASAA